MLLTFSNLMSQQKTMSVIVSPNLDFEELEIPENIFDQLVETSKKVMQNYNNTASLFDRDKDRVSQAAIDRYIDNFSDNAKIVDDFSPRLLNDRNVRNYASQVLDYLPKEGVQFEMRTARIRDVVYDETGYYEVEVQANKTLYNGVNLDNSTFKCKTGRGYFLKFYIVIYKEEIQNGKIRKIDGSISRQCEDANATFGLYARGGSDLLNLSSFNGNTPPSGVTYQDAKADFELNTNVSVVGSVGFTFNIPITKKEQFFLSLNAGYSLFQLKTTAIGTYFFKEDESTNTNVINVSGIPNEFRYDKFVRMNIAEKNAVHGVELPLGFKYKKTFQDNDRLNLGASILIVPSFQFGNTTSVAVGDLAYWANLDFINGGVNDDGANLGINFQDHINDDELSPFGIGEVDVEAIEDLNPVLEFETAFGLRFSPYVQYAVSNDKKKWLELSVEYNHGLTNVFIHTEEDIPFLSDVDDDLLDIPAEYENSLLSSSFSNSKLNTISLRLSFLFKL